MHKCMDHNISMLPLLHIPEPAFLCMKNYKFVEVGQFEELMAGIWVKLYITIGALKYFPETLHTAALQTMLNFPCIPLPCLFRNQQTKALKQPKKST